MMSPHNKGALMKQNSSQIGSSVSSLSSKYLADIIFEGNPPVSEELLLVLIGIAMVLLFMVTLVRAPSLTVVKEAEEKNKELNLYIHDYHDIHKWRRMVRWRCLVQEDVIML